MNSVGYVLNQPRTAMLGGMCRWHTTSVGGICCVGVCFEMGNMAWWAVVLLNECNVVFLVDGHSHNRKARIDGVASVLVPRVCFIGTQLWWLSRHG